jgi:dienelactone hydrolase
METHPCCPPDALGPLQPPPPGEYTPQGHVVGISSELQAYVVNEKAKTTGKAVICFYDLFGIDSGHTRLICDRYAVETGNMVVCPFLLGNDFWSWGNPMDKWYKMPFFIMFLRRNNSNKILGLYPDLFKWLQQQGIAQFTWFSFCWGAVPGVLASSNPMCKGGVAYHPSFKVFGFYGGMGQDEAIGKVQCPLLLCPCNGDGAESREQAPKTMKEVAKQTCEIMPFDEMQHGFVNRGDRKDPKVLLEIEKAVCAGVRFMKQYMA